MLRTVRMRSRAIAVWLMVSLASAFASEAAPGHASDGHDAACLPLESALHNEADHLLLDTFGNSSSAQASHCLVCHWARTFRPLGPATTDPVPVPQYRTDERPLACHAPVVQLSAQLTLRSPPASSLSI